VLEIMPASKANELSVRAAVDLKAQALMQIAMKIEKEVADGESATGYDCHNSEVAKLVKKELEAKGYRVDQSSSRVGIYWSPAEEVAK